MSILINQQTTVLIQGITGAEGSRAAHHMIAYGTKVAAGVTPGKGGQSVSGVPVYNTVAEALKRHPQINASLISVPPVAVLDASREALAGGIKLVNILTESVPAADTARLVAEARLRRAILVGPSSVGIISPGEAKIGSIGGDDPSRVYTPGPVGVISKSGGMASEICALLSQAGLGQSTVIGVGGDILAGFTFEDALLMFEKDSATKASVIFGEIGGIYEMRLAERLRAGVIKKPVVAYIAGRSVENFATEAQLGHAGALIEGEATSATAKITALKKAGAAVAQTLDEIPIIVKQCLQKRQNL